jgi:hypothetical protein
MAAFFMRSPVVQLEGIIADAAMVRAIARERPLAEVLAENHVTYFVQSGTDRLERAGGAYHVRCPNPEQAGAYARALRGTFTAEPAFAFDAFGVHTYVFRTEGSPPQ